MASFLLLALWLAAIAHAEVGAGRLVVADDVSVAFPQGWGPPTHRRAEGAFELVSPPQTRDNQPTPQARLVVTTERRRDHEEALRRLNDVAGEVQGSTEFLTIGGWPALERRYVAPLPHAPEETHEATVTDFDKPATFVTTAIAVGNLVVRLDAVLGPGGSPKLADDVLKMGREVSVPVRSDPELLERELKDLRAPHSSLDLHTAAFAARGAAFGGMRPGNPSLVTTGFGELEVAVSSDARDIVIARMGGILVSNDGGLSFHLAAQNGSVTNFPPKYAGDGDFSAAVGASGRFYVSFIDTPPMQKSAVGTASSTDRGQTFVYLSDAVRCPVGGCFTDQPHMAADRFAAGANGSDQLYVVYRNFGPLAQAPPGSGSNIAAIVCSPDGGTTWTAPAALPGGGASDFPRLAVGPDGSVYVVSRSGVKLNLQKYSSCASGLNTQTGFPVAVATVSDKKMCPIPGLDRCNGGNSLSSHMVAPDDTRPSQVYIAFANTSTQGNEDIWALESDNGGQTFPNQAVVSAAQPAHRFMPWICSTRGTAFVSWYDRSRATQTENSLTDYVLGTVSKKSGILQLDSFVNLSGNADDQCATGFPGGQEFTNLATTCVPPQTPGNGGGIPKYGDYNGNACVGGVFFGAWASATAPPGDAPVNAITIFADKLAPPCQAGYMWDPNIAACVCAPKTVAEACGTLQCAGNVPDGCGSTITCPANCPSGEVCDPVYGSLCCTPPMPGQILPNQCPPICPKCPLGYLCAAGVGEPYGYCVLNTRCPVGRHYCIDPATGKGECLPQAHPCPNRSTCHPKTVAEACGALQCAGDVSDGCGGRITCPANCPSGEVCNPFRAAGTNACCAPPLPGKVLPNQCPQPRSPPSACDGCNPLQDPECCNCNGGLWRDGQCFLPCSPKRPC